jgi:hypothetical protein
VSANYFEPIPWLVLLPTEKATRVDLFLKKKYLPPGMSLPLYSSLSSSSSNPAAFDIFSLVAMA